MRAEAMRRPIPPDWIPSAMDEVFLPARSPFLNVQEGTIVRVLDEDVVTVSYIGNGGRRYEVQLYANQLRPTGRKMVCDNRSGIIVPENPEQRWRLSPKR